MPKTIYRHSRSRYEPVPSGERDRSGALQLAIVGFGAISRNTLQIQEQMSFIKLYLFALAIYGSWFHLTGGRGEVWFRNTNARWP